MSNLSIPYKIVKKQILSNLESAIQNNESEIKSATEFIKEIEKGNLETIYLGNGDSDMLHQSELADSLISMRDKMKLFAEEEKERNWATEGLAKFVEILRSNNNDLTSLANDIIKNLVKYMGANQGGLFITNDDNPSEIYLELIACYAYDRKKFLEKKIHIGEGLVGQAYIEKDFIYLSEVPQNYANITSGLGQASPTHVLIVPLKVNEDIYGIVEIASFNEIKKYQKDFLERLGESIASTISTVKINEKTKRLLAESQMQAEELRSQEEEVRQNMEELSATQEEMQRLIKDMQLKEQYLNSLINVSTDVIFTIDKNYKIISYNRTFEAGFETLGIKVEKGFDILQIFGEEDKEKQKSNYDRVLKGETFEKTDSSTVNGIESYFSSNHAPLYNESGELYAAAIFSRDVTEITKAKHKTEALLKESQLQTESLKAQEEELRQNMEEIQATQEELNKKNSEIEEIRKTEKERADNQINTQKKLMENYIVKMKTKEDELSSRIALLESKLKENKIVI